MGTLSKSIKKLKRMEEELFAMRLHLDNLRVKLKKPKYFIGVDYAKDTITSCSGFKDTNGIFHIEDITEPITLNVPLSTFDDVDEERCHICGEIIPKFCSECGKKIAGTKNIIYGMEEVVDWYCLSCYWNKVKGEINEDN